MEQEELTVDPQYLKGFNNGYLLQKYEPALAAQLAAHPNDHSEYFKGLVGGKQQFEKEAMEWAKSFSKRTPEPDLAKDQNKDLGKEK